MAKLLSTEDMQFIRAALAKSTPGHDREGRHYVIDTHNGLLKNLERIIAIVPCQNDLHFLGNARMYVEDLLAHIEALPPAPGQTRSTECAVCKGTGRGCDVSCPRCAGTGRVAVGLPSLRKSLSHEAVEAFIDTLQSQCESDDNHTLVAGNIRNFARHLRELLP